MNNGNETLAEVAAVLTSVLQLNEQVVLTESTRLLGGIPEFDSLAVATVVIALEERFDLTFDDDDINAELFETVGTLAAFVDQQKRPVLTGTDGPQAGFFEAESGRLYYVRRDPPGAASRCVLFVAPFGEEMNRVRSLVTTTALALNEAGLSVCLFDFYGTGDSAGEFGDARWQLWHDNLRDMIRHLHAEGFAAIDLVAIRLGAALALEHVNRPGSEIARLVFWDPVFDGRSYMDRFLRTRTMAAMMVGKTESVKDLQARLQAGNSVEVGGYELHPELAAAISSIVPANQPPAPGVDLYWISRDEAEPGLLAALSVASAIKVDYEAYWASAEPVPAPALIAATRRCLTDTTV